MSNFDASQSIFVSAKLVTKKLYLMAYSPRQKFLFDTVSHMHENKRFSFRRIADELALLNILSPRCLTFTAELAYSIYKKGKLRAERLDEKAILSIGVVLVQPYPD